jgi:hypothetical protein
MHQQPHLIQGIAPIFGKDPCCFIAGGAHIQLPLASLGSKLLDGFCLLVDIQPEGSAPSVLLRAGVSGKTSLIVHYHEGGKKNRIRCDVCDDDGRILSGGAQLSKYAAKRLIICGDVRNNKIDFHEFNIHALDMATKVCYSARDSPMNFSEFSQDMILGGKPVNGDCVCAISTKIANFAAWDRLLEKEEIEAILGAIKRDLNHFYGKHAYIVNESSERRSVFRDDMNKIRTWAQKSSLAGADTRDAAIILYRWLFDRHPMLQDLCNEIGIQLTFPGPTDLRNSFYRFDVLKQATLMMIGKLGKRNLLGFQWVPLAKFKRDTVMMAGGTSVSVEMLIKFGVTS